MASSTPGRPPEGGSLIPKWALAGAAFAAAASAHAPAPPVRIPLPGARPAQPPAILDQRPGTLMVQLSGPPVGRYVAAARRAGRVLPARRRVTIRARLAARQRALRPRITATGARVLGQYRDAYDGIKVRATPRQASVLAGLPGVVGVRAMAPLRPSLTESVPFIGADTAWADLGRTGAGVKVAIIDSGVDYYHADLGGSGNPADFQADDGLTVGTPAFPNARVVGGWDFVGNAYDGATNAVAAPDPDPLDCLGHGTHVAGIAAGNGVLADGTAYAGPYDGTTYAAHAFLVGPGVAPRASIYAYKVFGCTGTTNYVVDAIDRAMADGVDVINLSLGSPFGSTDDPDAVAADTAAKAGITVVTSGGNSGPSAFTAETPGTADRVISVASEETVGSLPGASLAGPAVPALQTVAANEPVIPEAGITGTLRVLGAPDGIALGCTAADYAGVQPGDIVVTRRGNCARPQRARLGAAAGAAAVIMVNDEEALPPIEGTIAGVGIPFLGVRASAAAALLPADGSAVTVSAAPLIPNPEFGALSAFSAGGPRVGDNALKPDVTAPGGSIASAGIGTGTGAARMSGTSMSAPHVAGVAALVKEAHPDWTSGRIKAAIMSTASADPAKLHQPDVRLAGAGLVQPRRAIDAVTTATTGDGTSSLSFGYAPLDGAAAPTRTLTLTNDAAAPVVYDLSAAFDAGPHGAVATVTPGRLEVPAGGTGTATLTLVLDQPAVAALPGADAGDPGALTTVQGAVTATPEGDAAGVYALRVPFLLAPRGLSEINVGPPAARFRLDGATLRKQAGVTNVGIHGGAADVFAWGLTDPKEGVPEVDVRSVGVQVVPGATPDDTFLNFAVNTWDRWSNPATAEFDIAVDTNGDGTADRFVVGADFGRVTTGTPDGRMAAFVFDANGTDREAFFATAPMNGSTVVLPARASTLGLSGAGARFTYRVNAFGMRTGNRSVDAVSGAASFRPFAPAVAQGDLLDLPPGATGMLNLDVDATAEAADPVLGWLVVSQDDANGAAQADQVPIGTVPAPA